MQCSNMSQGNWFFFSAGNEQAQSAALQHKGGVIIGHVYLGQMLAPQTSHQLMEVGQRTTHYHTQTKDVSAMTL